LDFSLRKRARGRSAFEGNVGSRNDVVAFLLDGLGVGSATERPELKVDVGTLRVDCEGDGVGQLGEWFGADEKRKRTLVDNLLP
jgi:hypothetical protein